MAKRSRTIQECAWEWQDTFVTKVTDLIMEDPAFVPDKWPFSMRESAVVHTLAAAQLTRIFIAILRKFHPDAAEAEIASILRGLSIPIPDPRPLGYTEED